MNLNEEYYPSTNILRIVFHPNTRCIFNEAFNEVSGIKNAIRSL